MRKSLSTRTAFGCSQVQVSVAVDCENLRTFVSAAGIVGTCPQDQVVDSIALEAEACDDLDLMINCKVRDFEHLVDCKDD